MKTYTYTLSKESDLNSIDFSIFHTQGEILAQVFSGHDHIFLQKVISRITSALPWAHCIGTTTDGEISQSSIYTNHTIVAISLFEKTTLQSTYVQGGHSFDNGAAIAKELVQDDTALLILFSDGTSTNGEAFLKGIESVAPQTIISGGMAGDNGQFIQTYVIYREKLLTKGAVGVALNSHSLHVFNDFRFNWSPIGVEHTIDHAENNRVFSIDGMSPVEFYAKYLGEQVSDALPATGIEFPLILKKSGIDVARAAIARHADNSLSFAGNLHSGERVRLGFGNATMILKESIKSLSGTYPYPIESFFVYSCMARRRYMPDFIELEIKPFAQHSSTVGFFTYGEFYHHARHNELLNQTFTVVALSESSDHQPAGRGHGREKPFENNSEHGSTIEALTHLINRSTEDYEAQAKELEEQKRYSQYLLEVQKRFIRHAIHETNTPLSVIMANIELYELYHGKHPNMINIEIAAKNIHNIYEDLSFLIKKEHIRYPKKMIDLADFVRMRLDFFNTVAQKKSIMLKLYNQSCCPIIHFNETKLQRVIDNNLSNAIKYTKSPGELVVSIHREKEKIKLCFVSHSAPIQNTRHIFNEIGRAHV